MFLAKRLFSFDPFLLFGKECRDRPEEVFDTFTPLALISEHNT
jgi:hypothetical protein